MKEAMDYARRNIHVSRAISKLDGKSSEYLDYLDIFSRKYGKDKVEKALKQLYKFNHEILDIKGLTAVMVISNYNDFT